MMKNVREMFGEIDIYLFDQILKERFTTGMSVLDAGCGGGRNLIYFLQNNYAVYGVDQNPEAISQVRMLAKILAPNLSPENFQIAKVEKMSFQNEQFDAVVSNAVLHFADHNEHFNDMLAAMWRVLKPGGIFFARLASSIGIENLIQPTLDGKFLLPEGAELFLVNEKLLSLATARLGGVWLEPLKTTNVQNLRCMTTWVLCKN